MSKERQVNNRHRPDGAFVWDVKKLQTRKVSHNRALQGITAVRDLLEAKWKRTRGRS